MTNITFYRYCNPNNKLVLTKDHKINFMSTMAKLSSDKIRRSKILEFIKSKAEQHESLIIICLYLDEIEFYFDELKKLNLDVGKFKSLNDSNRNIFPTNKIVISSLHIYTIPKLNIDTLISVHDLNAYNKQNIAHLSPKNYYQISSIIENTILQRRYLELKQIIGKKFELSEEIF